MSQSQSKTNKSQDDRIRLHDLHIGMIVWFLPTAELVKVIRFEGRSVVLEHTYLFTRRATPAKLALVKPGDRVNGRLERLQEEYELAALQAKVKRELRGYVNFDTGLPSSTAVSKLTTEDIMDKRRR